MRDAIRFMALSGWESYHLAAKRGVTRLRGPPALARPKQRKQRHDKSCPCRRWLEIFDLEGVTQRKLNQPRRAHGAGDFAERPGRKRLPGDLIVRNALDVVDRWIAEVRVVPNVEEVGRKSQL